MFRLETKRLLIRDFSEADWEAVQRYAGQENILVYEAWGPNTPEETREFIALSRQAAAQLPRFDFDLAITLKASQQLIGGCSFHIFKEATDRGDFGYIVHPDFWGQGIATEAATALMQYMASNRGVQVVEATCDVLNLASKRVLEKCGLEIVHRINDHMFIKGRHRDTFVWEKKLPS